MALSGTKLRENVYQVLDQALETGESVELRRKGRTLRIVPDRQGSRMDMLQKRPTLLSQPEDLIHMDWSSEWKP